MIEEYVDLIKKNKAVVVGMIVLVLVAGIYFAFRPTQSAAETDFPKTTATETVTDKEGDTSEPKEAIADLSVIHVDVKGAVKNEGIYQLDTDARVNDAIQAAGGFSDQADKKSVNLAQKLSDEAVVYVASQGENISVVTAPTANANTEASTGDTAKVNLNTANVSELTTISGIGEKRANDIIAYRDSNGGFKSVDDLSNVSGIGSKTLENIRPYVTVD